MRRAHSSGLVERALDRESPETICRLAGPSTGKLPRAVYSSVQPHYHSRGDRQAKQCARPDTPSRGTASWRACGTSGGRWLRLRWTTVQHDDLVREPTIPIPLVVCVFLRSSWSFPREMARNWPAVCLESTSEPVPLRS